MAITINVNLDEILAALKDDLTFTGNADKYIKVNATADGFEFAAVSGGGGGTWGSITGTLSDQTDLQSALDAKYDASNPSGYITGIAWGAITGTLSSQTDLQSALDLKANLAGASFTGDVSITTSGSGDTLQLTNSGSGTTLNITNSGSGDFLAIDSTKLVIDNGGDVSIGTATASARFHVLTGSTSKVGAIIQAAAGQTANLLEVKNSGGTNLFEIKASGKVYLGNNTPHANDATNIVTVNGIMSLSNGFIRINGQNRVQIGTSAWVWDTAITPVAKGFSGYANQDLTIRTGSTSYNLNLGLVSQTNLRIANTTGNVLIGTTTDVASSVLTAHSTTKGFLPPRMTGAQVEAISSPAEGLIAYATNAGAGDVTAKGLYIYNGTNWVSL